jgi:excisionase family DNA binding protein
MENDPNESLGFTEAAIQLKISRSTMTRWLKNGTVPGRKVGHRWIIPADDVRRLLDPRLKPAQATPQTNDQKIGLRDGFPPKPNWLNTTLSPEEVSEISQQVCALLQAGGAPAKIEEVQALIKGDEVFGPIFWRCLVSGIQILTNVLSGAPSADAVVSLKGIPTLLYKLEGSNAFVYKLAVDPESILGNAKLIAGAEPMRAEVDRKKRN